MLIIRIKLTAQKLSGRGLAALRLPGQLCRSDSHNSVHLLPRGLPLLSVFAGI